MSRKKLIAYNLVALNSIVGFLTIVSIAIITFIKGPSATRLLFRKSVNLITSSNFSGEDSKLDKLNNKIKELKSSNKKELYFPAYHWNPSIHKFGEQLWLSRPSSSFIVRKDEGSGIIPFKTNSLGHRLVLNESLDRPIEAIFIGDSFTEGCCVQTGYTLPDYYASITEKNVLNLGISGTGPGRQFATLINFIEYANSKDINFNDDANVYWIVFTNNDLNDLNREKSLIPTNYLNPKGSNNYYSNISLHDNEQKIFLSKLSENLALQKRSMLPYFSYSAFTKADIENSSSELIQILTKANDLCLINNLNLKIIVLSDYPDTPIDSLAGMANQSIKKYVQSNAKLNSLIYSFKDNPPRILTNHPKGRKFGHYDEEGYFELALFISNSFK